MIDDVIVELESVLEILILVQDTYTNEKLDVFELDKLLKGPIGLLINSLSELKELGSTL